MNTVSKRNMFYEKKKPIFTNYYTLRRSITSWIGELRTESSSKLINML